METKLNDLSHQNNAHLGNATSIQLAHFFEGPFPHPALLAQYENVQPGFAQRIISFAEQEIQHRHEIDKALVKHAIATQKTGQQLGFIIGITAIFATACIAVTAKTLAAGITGSVLSGTTILGLVSAFIIGRLPQNDNNKDNSTQVEAK